MTDRLKLRHRRANGEGPRHEILAAAVGVVGERGGMVGGREGMIVDIVARREATV
ncbi:hypothetical protein AB4305_33135 [Nocardia sp. 2YAB30]|uniref:hypothetical protein n=1 Tax=unclassified Nocardia TaxID=2637762 RepID=UPI003F9598FA